MILTKDQAEDLLAAAAVLRLHNMLLHARMLWPFSTHGRTDDFVNIKEWLTDEVQVWEGAPEGRITGRCERYRDWDEFERAYKCGPKKS